MIGKKNRAITEGDPTVIEEKKGNVLVAAKRRRLVSEFENALRPEYNVWTATSGQQALDIVDNEVDVVAVTPETTDMAGTAVVSETRKRGIDCKAVVVGRKDDARFDGHIRTPVTQDAIVETVEDVTETDERRVFGGWFADGNPVAEDYKDWKVAMGFGNDRLTRFNR
ncbi:MAG: hypothetical protein ACLFSW_00925 [Halobacteriales archaeon]